jgi:hypothetical protein
MVLSSRSTPNQAHSCKVCRVPTGVAFPPDVKSSIEQFARREYFTFSTAVVRLCCRALEQLKQEAGSAR